MKNTYWPILMWACLLGTTLTAQVAEPDQIAARYLMESRADLKLTQADIADYEITNTVVTRHNKVTHVYLQQQHAGIPVRNAILNMNITENGEVFSMGNRFISDLSSQVNTTQPQISMETAVRKLMAHANVNSSAPLSIDRQPGEHHAIFNPAGLALEPIEVHLAYQPVRGAVRLAWNVTFYELSGQHWWDARIDAITGEVLDAFDQVLHCQFGPHVASEEHQALHQEHQHAETFSLQPPLPPSSPEDGSRYRVFPLTVESPNHGDRILKTSPADSMASPFGWHDEDGMPGPEYTITRGNNVHAYHDIFDLNASVGDEPDGGDSLNFDFPLDLSTNRPFTQIDPLVTNLFYWNNIMHDVWYYYGFDEAAGNFQTTNYTGFGEGGDYVRAEALDGSGTNNANFATPTDGNRPRMQMYLWGGALPNLDTDARLTVTDTAGNATDYTFVQAGFGGALPEASAPLSGELVLVEDEAAPVTDACEDLVNAAALEGKIAIIDRGNCEFGFKVLSAENAGAIGAIICNNVAGDPIIMGAGAVGDQVTIPSVMITQGDCAILKTLLPGATITLSAPELQVPNPGPSGLSSDLDNGVIVHEYTHGISIRLTGGAGNSGCLGNFEQAGEGWSDWYALAMTTTSENTADQVRGIGTYVVNEPTNGGGIRTYPYTRNMNVNPHTYSDINGESVPHGVGSVWCAMIWDMYWNLVDEYGFDDNLYTGTGGNNIAMQLVTDGLKLQPCGPTFLDARDAILEADMLNYDGANQCLIWETFARRGLGASAIAGGVEAFDIPDACNFTFRVNKTGVTEADAGDVITYNLEIINGRTVAVEDGIVTDLLPEGTTFVEGSSSCPATVEDGVLTFDLGAVESGATINCSYQVALDDDKGTYAVFEDGAEEGLDNWTLEAPVGTNNWQVTNVDAYSGNTSFFARNLATASEQRMTIEVPMPNNGQRRGISFWHRFDTENGWDGGIVEISPNGIFWLNASGYILENNYNGTLNPSAGHDLAGQLAFTGDSDGWIQTTIDLESISWSNIMVRFRFASDDQTGGNGWYVDDVRVLGELYSITNVACAGEGEEALCDETTTIVNIENPVATREPALQVALTLSPNPTKGKVVLALDEPLTTRVDLEVLSADGRQLRSEQFDSLENHTLDFSGYSAGVYLVRLRTKDGVTTRKVIVQ
ncbi:T9SS-dependent M36 family metallopeptidase [Phaeodactylibacter xiamenensis]|uniref:T9SS-dependent M36 family metallopeptidase n=1 Tax=Phaeodactylibacter xiamenensis TaxID=1524460 RepID=UPI003BA89579